MGKTLSIDSTYGEIVINGIQKTYHTGTNIQGTVIVRLNKNFPSNTMHLVLKGKEKVKLAKDPHSHNHQHDHEHHGKNYIKQEEEIYYQTFPLVFNGPCFPCGTHSFPFNISLPIDMPPSFEQKFHKTGVNCYGKVKYKLSAVLQTSCKEAALCDDHKIEILPSPLAQNMVIRNDLVKEISVCDFDFKCSIDKNYVSKGNVINGWMSLDNCRSSSDVKRLKWKTIMLTRLSARGNNYSTRTRIDKVYLGGVLAGHSQEHNIQFNMNVPSSEEFKNPYSYNGKLIQNYFVLEFAAMTPTMIFFSKENKVAFDLIVKSFAPQNLAPNGFMPMPNQIQQNMPMPNQIQPNMPMPNQMHNNNQFNGDPHYNNQQQPGFNQPPPFNNQPYQQNNQNCVVEEEVVVEEHREHGFAVSEEDNAYYPSFN